jgi:UDP-2-acetamido-3-amino-2,3-dideoxy-glucuronate N-acetyltransferase
MNLPFSYVANSSIIDANVSIGTGTKIWNFSHISSGASIGENCIIGDSVFVGKDVIIGNGCKIQNGAFIPKGVTLREEVFVGPGTIFTNVKNPRAFVERKHEFLQTIVEKGATIGANCTIICGVIIGTYAMIGAGSVVTKNIIAYRLAIGNPAKVVGAISKDGEQIYY